MKDFDRWFADVGRHEPRAAARIDLPDGVFDDKTRPGVYFAHCCVCERADEIPCELSELPATGYRHHCGGSPSCCP